ncbi:hypothetical protein ACTHT3_19620, partial [Neisseria sp. P0015.S004]
HSGRSLAKLLSLKYALKTVIKMNLLVNAYISDLGFLPHLFCCYFTGLYSRIKDGLFEEGRLKTL